MATPNATTPNPTGGRAVLRSLSEMQLARILPPVGTVVRQLPGDARRGAGQLTRRTMQNLLSDPPLPVLTLLRRFRPRMSVKRLTLVTRGQDVIDVLTDADRYRVTPYATLMRRLAGPFALGLDGEDHRIARSRIAQTLERIDTAELGRWADAYATWLVADARAEGRIDLVTEYAQPLAARFVAEYLGVPEPAPDPNEPERGTSSWAGRFFEGCFLNLAGDRVVARRAESAAHELRKWISAAVDARTADDLSPDRTVLDRLVRADPQDPHGVTTDLIGLVVATIPMISEAFVRVVDHLLDNPDRAAAVAAADGDRGGVWEHVQESLRFSPASPGLVRAAACPAASRGGTTAGREELVMASTRSAMHDPTRVGDPGRYRAGREVETYLHFGIGPHRCLGEPFARELLVSALTVLVRQPRLARTSGPRGRLVWDGPSAAHLVVELQPG